MYHYKEKKKKKLAKLAREDEVFHLTLTKFNTDTGEKKEPIVCRLEKESIEQRKAEFEKQVEDLAELLKDMEALMKGDENED